eukprot:5144155-Amphidinium_carterae.1
MDHLLRSHWVSRATVRRGQFLLVDPASLSTLLGVTGPTHSSLLACSHCAQFAQNPVLQFHDGIQGS